MNRGGRAHRYCREDIALAMEWRACGVPHKLIAEAIGFPSAEVSSQVLTRARRRGIGAYPVRCP